MPGKTGLAAIHKTVTIARPVEAAFRVFMNMRAWWPRTHSYHRDRVEEIGLENRVGGRFYERHTDGGEFVIGRVVAYEPPRRVVFTWQGPDMAQPTEVAVTFHPDGNGTRVELVHGGWDRVGTKIEHGTDEFSRGWDTVLQAYVAAA